MRRSLWVVFILSVFLLVPSRAYAFDLGSFDDGLGDFFEPDVLEVEPSEGSLGFGLLGATGGSEPTLLSQIQTTVDRCAKIPWSSSAGGTVYNFGLLPMIRSVLTGYHNPGVGAVASKSPVVLAVSIVFVWWGVRKTIKMLMAAWRKGHASV